MARYKFYIEYDGTRYSGWQVQQNSRTIQGEFFSAIKKIFNTDDFEFQGSGRTDAGVHAIEQIAHLDVNSMLAPEILKLKFNDELPADINVLEVEKCYKNFHARKDAVSRSYLYIISKRRTSFGKKYVWWIKDKLNVTEMIKISKLFLGMNDFQSFTDDSPEEKSTKVVLDEIKITEDENLILIRIRGSHFIWKLVRRIIGVLVEVGRGKINQKDIERFLQKPTNEPARFTAPPSGLFLEKIYFGKDEFLQDINPIINLSPLR